MYAAREYQGRVNAILQAPRLIVDGMTGPKTRAGIAEAMKVRKVRKQEDLFDRGVRGVVWHWTAGANGLIELEKEAYNFLTDTKGNIYDGNSTIAEQVMYDWRKGIGASHTKSMNTGWVGVSQDAMAGANGWPMKWGSHPITWEGTDAMLEKTWEICCEYNIPVSPWTTLSHAEVQQTLGVAQRNKWDYMVLPCYGKPSDAVKIGNVLRARMLEKFG
jgi:hypothetical protein